MRKLLPAIVLFVFASLAFAQSTQHLAARIPLQGNSRDIGADRTAPAPSASAKAKVSPAANPWKLQATLSGAVIHDISFPTPKIGYAAAELGQVWKTTNGGSHWTEILNLGFPYYWYGVTALSANEVVISGFNDSNF